MADNILVIESSPGRDVSIIDITESPAPAPSSDNALRRIEAESFDTPTPLKKINDLFPEHSSSPTSRYDAEYEPRKVVKLADQEKTGSKNVPSSPPGTCAPDQENALFLPSPNDDYDSADDLAEGGVLDSQYVYDFEEGVLENVESQSTAPPRAPKSSKSRRKVKQSELLKIRFECRDESSPLALNSLKGLFAELSDDPKYKSVLWDYATMVESPLPSLVGIVTWERQVIKEDTVSESQNEDTVLLLVNAAECLESLVAGTLLEHINRVATRKQKLVLLWGVVATAKTLDKACEQEYSKRLREALGDKTHRRSRTQSAGTLFTSKDLELSLLEIERSGWRIIRCENLDQVKNWIPSMTVGILNRPRALVAMQRAAAMGTGTERTSSGSDLTSMYHKMLLNVRGMTPALAEGVAAKFPTLRRLFEAFAQCETETERMELLMGISKTTTVSGLPSQQRIGPVLSKRLCVAITNEDPQRYVD